MSKNRVGIYAGTFDPVHSGHISFALQALREAHLDEVYFLPERTPRRKVGTEHYGHRVAMLRRAVLPHASISLLELVDKHFTIKRTVPQLKKTFDGNKLVFLMGSDAFMYLPEWPGISQIVQSCEFVVSIRSKEQLQAVLALTQHLGIPTKSITIVDSLRPDVSSTELRHALRHNTAINGLLSSVAHYARREWLYIGIK